jgi:hypothetical protein
MQQRELLALGFGERVFEAVRQGGGERSGAAFAGLVLNITTLSVRGRRRALRDTRSRRRNLSR